MGKEPTKRRGLFRQYLYLAHCESGTPSSKRFWGGIGFGICQLCILAATVLSFIHTGELSGTVSSLIDFDLVTSASLIGLTTIMRTFGGNRTSISNEKTPPPPLEDEEIGD